MRYRYINNLTNIIKNKSGSLLIESILVIFLFTISTFTFLKLFFSDVNKAGSEVVLIDASNQYDTFYSAVLNYSKTITVPNSTTIVTVDCDTLKTQGYLSSSFPCTDILEQTLQGKIFVSNGVIQTIISAGIPTSKTNNKLKTLGIDSITQLTTILLKTSAYNLQGTFYLIEKQGTNVNLISLSNILEKDDWKSYVSNLNYPTDAETFLTTKETNRRYTLIYTSTKTLSNDIGYWVISAMFVGNARTNNYSLMFNNFGFSKTCPNVSGSVSRTPTNISSTNINLASLTFGVNMLSSGNIYFCIPTSKSFVNMSLNLSSFNTSGNLWTSSIWTWGPNNGQCPVAEQNRWCTNLPSNYPAILGFSNISKVKIFKYSLIHNGRTYTMLFTFAGIAQGSASDRFLTGVYLWNNDINPNSLTYVAITGDNLHTLVFPDDVQNIIKTNAIVIMPTIAL